MSRQMASGRVAVALRSSAAQEAIRSSFVCDGATSSTGSLPSAAVRSQAAQCVSQLASLMASEHGLRLAGLKKSEVARFVKDAKTAAPGTFSSSEYKTLVEVLAKYAALKALRKNGRRWGLGLTMSAAGATAVTAAVFTSPTLLLVAAPAGAAIGALAVLADGAKMRRSDRRAARRSAGAAPSTTPAAPALATPVAAAAAPAGPAEFDLASPAPPAQSAFATAAALAEEAPEIEVAAAVEAPVQADKADAVPAPVPMPAAAAEPAAANAAAAAPASAAPAPAADPAEVPAAEPPVQPPRPPAPLAAPPSAPAHVESDGGSSSSRGSASEDMVSAVVEVAPAAAMPKAPTPPAAPAAADATADEEAAAAAELPLLAPSATPEPGSKELDDVPVADVRAGSGRLGSGAASALPPLPLEKSGSLKRGASSLMTSNSLRQSFKSFKKVLSISSSGKGGKASLDGTPRASDAGSEAGSLDAPPSSTRASRAVRGLSFGRRRSSEDSASDAAGGSGSLDLVVEPSKGSATLKKWGDKLRRSFSIDREAPRSGAGEAPAPQHAATTAA